jgi:hypothetical protein
MLHKWILALLCVTLVSASGGLAGAHQPAPHTDSNNWASLSPSLTAIHQRGLLQNNVRKDVFSKIGDSITVASYFFLPLGQGRYNLGDYAYLQDALNYFTASRARTANSFANTSLAADNQWTTYDVLDPKKNNKRVCYQGESPLVCEYRLVRPAVALIMLGTNDITSMSGAVYQENMLKIVQTSIEWGVIPVLSTIPPRESYDLQVQEFNQIVRTIGANYSLPLWEYHDVMVHLPQRGLSEDNVHPSYPPGDVGLAAHFLPEFIQYGYTQRNLTGLILLDGLWRNVLAPPPPPPAQ